MSDGRNNNDNSDLEATYSSILDLVAAAKTGLHAIISGQSFDLAPLTNLLSRIASSAEKFSCARTRLDHTEHLLHYTDTLDTEGVNIWNLTGTLSGSSEDGKISSLIPSLRLAAFRLVEAGLEEHPGIEALVNILQMASKAGVALADCGLHETAGVVLTSAAKFEDALRKTPDPQHIHRTEKSTAIAIYFCSRMEAAWKERNLSLAEYMAKKILDQDQPLTLSAPYREIIAGKLLGIGRDILSEQGNGPHYEMAQQEAANSAVSWLQMAIALIDQEEHPSRTMLTLKMSLLRTIARAFFFAAAYDRADATLDELLSDIGQETKESTPGLLELQWLRLAVLKRQQPSDNMLSKALQGVVKSMQLSEASLLELLQELRSFRYSRKVIVDIHTSVLSQVTSCLAPDVKMLETLLLSLIVHLSKEDHTASIQTILDVFKVMADANCSLPRVPAAACTTLLWRYGSQHFGQKQFHKAADWFLLGTHSVLESSSSSSKCRRKAALCYIEQKDFSKAATTLKECDLSHAADCYVLFLCAVHQGLEDEAIRYVNTMVAAQDFDRKMLLLATQISHESSLRSVLLAVLQALLNYTREDAEDGIAEALALIRCIIRLALKMLQDPAINRATIYKTIIQHLENGLRFSKIALERNTISPLVKDLQWLWRTAHNAALDQCHCTVEAAQAAIRGCRLFELSRDFIDCCIQASVGQADQELYIHWVSTAFSAISGHVFEARHSSAERQSDHPTLAASIVATRLRIDDYRLKMFNEQDRCRMDYFNHVLCVFEAELRVHEHDWDGLLKVVKDIISGGPTAVDTYEAIADILWENKDCPINILHTCLEAILHGSLDQSKLSVEKFSRWLRAICTISLARHNREDRLKAVGYVEQAVEVLKDHEDYPSDERMWLMSTAYNTGYECLQSSAVSEAKRWFELSTVICKYVENGQRYVEKIARAYSQTLELQSRRND